MQVLLHPIDQPVFRIRGNATQCRVELRINDVPVHRETSGQAHDFDLAINEWFFQGENRIDVHLSPLEKDAPMSQGAFFELRLLHRISREVVRGTVELGEFVWRPEPPLTAGHSHSAHQAEAASASHEWQDEHDDSAPLLALPCQPEEVRWRVVPPVVSSEGVKIAVTVTLPPPWPVCPWARLASLGTQAGVGHAVSNLLRSLHHTLRLGGWREMMKRRTASIQAAYYLGGDEVDEALGFPSLLNNPSWSLAPLPESRLILEDGGNGRLVHLLDPTTGSSPLMLVNQTSRVSAILDAWWMFDKEWVIIR
jgi:hypothetical protein